MTTQAPDAARDGESQDARDAAPEQSRGRTVFVAAAPTPEAQASIGTPSAMVSGVLVALAAAAAVASPTLVVLPIAGLVALWASWRVVHRFELLVLGLLALRPVIDLSARSGGLVSQLPSVLGMGLIVSGTLWLWLNRRAPRDAPASRLRIAAALLVLAAVLATVAAPAPVISAVDSLRLVGGLMMLFLVARLVDAGTPPARLLAAWAAAATFAVGFPLVGAATGFSITHVKDDAVALRSSFVLSNNLAHFLVPAVLVAGGVALRSRGTTRIVAGGFATLGLFQIVLTATRGAWLAAAVGLVVLGLLLDRRLLGLATAAAVAVALLVPTVNARLVDLLPDDRPRTESSLAWRFGQWEEAIEQLDDSPVLGTGPAMTREDLGKEPHSEWVRFLVEFGVVGLLAWTAFVAAAVSVAVRLRRLAPRGSIEDGFAAGVIATVLAFVVATFGENLALTTSYAWYLMLVLGIADSWVVRAEHSAPPRLTLPDGSIAWHG